MSMVDTIKKHWLSWLIPLLIVTVGITWYVSIEILVKPRNYTINELKAKNKELEQEYNEITKKYDECKNHTNYQELDNTSVLDPTWLRNDEGVRFLSNQATLTLVHLSHTSAMVKMLLPDGSRTIWDIVAGSRKSFTHDGEEYHLDVLGLEKDRARFAISLKDNK